MCNLSEIILEEGIEMGIVKGKIQTLCELVQQGQLSIYAAAEYMGIECSKVIGSDRIICIPYIGFYEKTSLLICALLTGCSVKRVRFKSDVF